MKCVCGKEMKKTEGVVMLFGGVDALDEEERWFCECGNVVYSKTGKMVNLTDEMVKDLKEEK